MTTSPQIATKAQGQTEPGPASLVIYLLLGIAFGVVLTKSEVLSWFRIQEMFRFQSFRMYGIMWSAIATAALSIAIIKRAQPRSISGEIISIPGKKLGSGIRFAAGGTIFGVGWALTGACPGPLVALIGNGVTVMIAAVLSALFGTWVYGLLRSRLPH